MGIAIASQIPKTTRHQKEWQHFPWQPHWQLKPFTANLANSRTMSCRVVGCETCRKDQFPHSFGVKICLKKMKSPPSCCSTMFKLRFERNMIEYSHLWGLHMHPLSFRLLFLNATEIFYRDTGNPVAQTISSWETWFPCHVFKPWALWSSL